MNSDASTPALQRLLSMQQLRQLIPLSASQIYRLVKAGAFPRQVRVSPNRVAWRQHDIERWLANGAGGASR